MFHAFACIIVIERDAAMALIELDGLDEFRSSMRWHAVRSTSWRAVVWKMVCVLADKVCDVLEGMAQPLAMPRDRKSVV